jgi:hypothetical protein
MPGCVIIASGKLTKMALQVLIFYRSRLLEHFMNLVVKEIFSFDGHLYLKSAFVQGPLLSGSNN